jgi:DNA helicase HerA-like ATPase
MGPWLNRIKRPICLFLNSNDSDIGDASDRETGGSTPSGPIIIYWIRFYFYVGNIVIMVELGKISGRVTTKRFGFEAEARVNKLDYVAAKDPEGQWVLAIIDNVIGYEERTNVSARIIGYRDGRGFLKTPKVPFRPGTPVYSAENDFIAETIGLPNKGAYMGLLEGYEIKVNLPIDKMIAKHIAILAKTGAGKSYATGVLIEELAENNVPAVVIDPHGEYHSLVKANSKQAELKFAEKFGVAPKSYKSQVQLYGLDGPMSLKLNSKLSAQEIFRMIPVKMSSGQKGVLYSALKNLEGKDYTIRDIIEEVAAIQSQSKWNVMSSLELLENTRIFSANPTKPEDLVKKSCISIIDLKEAKPETQQMVVLKLTEELFEARKHGKIPSFLFIMEEAHNFCPERGFGEVASSGILRTIASEGRKFGLGLCIISQRPARVDKSVLSQCNTQIILKVTNPNDLKAITDSVEGVTPGMREEIRDLPIGVALIVGASDQPLMIDIRIRKSQHGGESIQIGETRPRSEEKYLMFKPRVSEEDVMNDFKELQEVKFAQYPLWMVKTQYKDKETRLFVDGVMGEVLFEKSGFLQGSTINRTSGIRALLELPPSSRLIVGYLKSHKAATADKMSSDLKIPGGTMQQNIRDLLNLNYITTDGYMFRSNFRLENVPSDPSSAEIKEKISGSKAGEVVVDFMVTADFARKVSELWNMKVLDIQPIYYPYWMISQKGRKILIDALSGKPDLHTTSIIEKLV